MFEIRAPTKEEVKDYVGFYPRGIREIFAAFYGGEMVGVCGVLRDPFYYGSILEEEGRWIAFLEISEMPFQARVQTILNIGRYLRSMREEIWVYCENTTYPDADQLLRRIGFVQTDEVRKNWRNPKEELRMWKWPA